MLNLDVIFDNCSRVCIGRGEVGFHQEEQFDGTLRDQTREGGKEGYLIYSNVGESKSWKDVDI
jgi:hypothetical protein